MLPPSQPCLGITQGISTKPLVTIIIDIIKCKFMSGQMRHDFAEVIEQIRAIIVIIISL